MKYAHVTSIYSPFEPVMSHSNVADAMHNHCRLSIFGIF